MAVRELAVRELGEELRRRGMRWALAAAGCVALLRWAGLSAPRAQDHALRREQMLDHLADAVERSLDVAQLLPRFAATTEAVASHRRADR